MKKSKLAGDIAVMEVSHKSTMGCRTRAAKALALQRLSKTTPPSNSPTQTDVSSFSYLQLRSRRLEKLASPVSNRTKQRQQGKGSGFREGEKKNGGKKSKGCFGNREIVVGVGFCCGTEQASFGEHDMDFELRDRSTRETTPCSSSLIKDFETIAAAPMTPRTSPSSCQRGHGHDTQRLIPTTQELEEFFSFAEQQQQRQFVEKYNFDIVNDLPLPGRYEWEKVGIP